MVSQLPFIKLVELIVNMANVKSMASSLYVENLTSVSNNRVKNKGMILMLSTMHKKYIFIQL
jgi:hypothetical protein